MTPFRLVMMKTKSENMAREKARVRDVRAVVTLFSFKEPMASVTI